MSLLSSWLTRCRASAGVRLLFAVLLVLVFIVSVLPMPQNASTVPISDKLVHVLIFVMLAFVATIGWPSSMRMIVAPLLLVGFGLLIELVQFTLPWRSFEWLDLLSDCIGVAIVWILARATQTR